MDQSLDEIFCDLLELPVEQRAAVLGASSALDESGKARVAKMLADAEKADAYFTGTSVAATMTSPASSVEQAGDMCGFYKLVRKLGEGGFGVVWLAQQERPLRRRVALKVIKAGMDSEEVLARFDAEKHALARMQHPHIARVLDAGATKLGRPYFVMELAEGSPITRYCDDKGLSLRDRLELYLDVCSAVNHAHQRGVIHRDIKPSNVIVASLDGKPVVKVIDFGIAKAMDGGLTDHTLRTQPEQWIGTPAYMSPEQAGMAEGHPDTRSDIYALGVLLYELISGAPPFDAATLLNAGYEEMRRIIREEDPPRPSARLAMESRKSGNTGGGAEGGGVARWHLDSRGVASELDWIVMKAIEKSRERRYDTAAALAEDLHRFLHNEPVSAKPPSAIYLLSKFARRHYRVLAVLIAFVLVLVGAVVFSSWQAMRAFKAEQQAEERLEETLRERNAREAALQESEAVVGLLSKIYQRPDPMIDGRNVTVVDALDAAVVNLENEMSALPERHARLLTMIADTHESLGIHEKSIELRQKALNLLRSAGDFPSPEFLELARSLVFRLGRAGSYAEAAELAEEEFLIRHELGDSAALLSEVLDLWATNTFRSGNYPRAIKLQEKLVGMLIGYDSQCEESIVDALRKLRAYCWNSGNLQQHEIFAEEFGELWEKAGQRRPRVIPPRVRREPGELEELLEILEGSEREIGEHTPQTITARENVVAALMDLGQNQEAIKQQRILIDNYVAVFGEDHPQTLATIDYCTEIARTLSDWDFALFTDNWSARIRADSGSHDHYESLEYHGHRMFRRSLSRRGEDGIRIGEEYLPQIRRVMGPNSRGYHHHSANFARAHAAAGRSREAIEILERACPHLRDDTFINLLYATLLVWHGETERYSALRAMMSDYAFYWRERPSRAFHLERTALICSLLPIECEDIRSEVATNLALAEEKLESPDFEEAGGDVVSWSRTIQAWLNYRLGNFDTALLRLEQAEASRLRTPAYNPDVEIKMAGTIRALAMNGLGEHEKAEKYFLEHAESISLWENYEEPLYPWGSADGQEVAAFLFYKEAAKIFGVEVPK